MVDCNGSVVGYIGDFSERVEERAVDSRLCISSSCTILTGAKQLG
jgi:hypothetical protein